MNDQTPERDARRAQLLGEVWLRDWLKDDRSIASDSDKGSGSWADGAKRNEAPPYAWIWYRPYLADADHDVYRSQQVGRYMLTRFSESELSASAVWFLLAEAIAGDHEWLFAANVFEFDGWRSIPQSGEKPPIWTKVKTKGADRR